MRGTLPFYRTWKVGGSVSVAIFALGLLLLLSSHGQAGDAEHLSVRVPGGMPGHPIFTSLTKSNHSLNVKWRGCAGPYQLQHCTNLASGCWEALGQPTLSKSATVSVGEGVSFFRVSGPSPLFAGSASCTECHRSMATSHLTTRHAQAYETLKAIGQEQNSSCLPCHTVGYALPTGFKENDPKKLHLAGVQCENCHGPAGNHQANPFDPLNKPPVDIAANVCGGCHTQSAQPTFDEWVTSGHAEVVEDMNPPSRIESCGRCHSGTARIALLKGDPLPVGDANVGLVCVVCHDPHNKTAHGSQLRNPTFSTNFYSLTTSAVFSNAYNPSVQICAQCHNSRGAAWTDTSRPPHHSQQYNILLGNIGVTTDANPPRSPHWMISNQCVTCHMQTKQVANPTAANPNNTGHSFAVESFEACVACHEEVGFAQFKKEATQEHTKERIQAVKAQLDLWAQTKAPAALYNQYGTRAWEYNSPGEISNPAGVTNRGPTTAEQTNSVPVNIRQARFNLYLVRYDLSYGVHNAAYARYLLRVAEDKVKEELAK